jgi:hypothetical protein
MVRGGVAIFRCCLDDGSRSLEVPQWMFDTATCCRAQLMQRAIVSYRVLYDLRELIQAAEQISSTPVLQAEHLIPYTEGGAHATQNSKDIERAAEVVRADSAAALDRHTDRRARAYARTAHEAAAPARSRASRIAGAR